MGIHNPPSPMFLLDHLLSQMKPPNQHLVGGAKL